MEAKWEELTGGKGLGQPMTVEVPQGRDIKVQRAYKNIAAEVDFDFLCNTPKSATDYMALANNFKTIVVR